MLEPWRSRYLQAMGVEVYLPRFQLPAAAPACIVEWDTELEQVIPAAISQHTDPEFSAVSSPLSASINSGFIKSPQLSANLADVNPAGSQTNRNETEPPSRGTPNNVTRIHLLAALSDSGILIVDDLPAQTSRRSELQRLYAQLLFAIQRKDAQLKLEAFEWPLTNLRNRQIDLDETAARETFSGFLNKKIQSAGVRSILLLGLNARKWVDDAQRHQLSSDTAVTWGLSVSGQQVMEDALLKRRWWKDLRHVGLPH